MPWGMWHYEGYRGLLAKGGIVQARIKAARPPPTQPHWTNLTWLNATAHVGSAVAGTPVRHAGGAAGGAAGGVEWNQRRCEANEDCRRFYRAHSLLYFGEDELCQALMSRQDSWRAAPWAAQAGIAAEPRARMHTRGDGRGHGMLSSCSKARRAGARP